MHYVSNSNYVQAIGRFAPVNKGVQKRSEAIAGLSRFSLRDVLNDNEIEIMYEHKVALEIVKRWSEYEGPIDVETIRQQMRVPGRFFVPQYVLKVSTPRYHEHEECKYLSSSFENFETPPEIAQLGQGKISEFQIFCETEWPQYKDKSIDVFWAHVGSYFRVSIHPKKVSYASQEAAELVRDRSEVEIAEEIQRAADQLRDHLQSNGLYSYRYHPPTALHSKVKSPNLAASERHAFEELLRLKKAIKMLVFNFHRIELEMPEGLLSDELLEALGFLPCKGCCGNVRP